MNEIKGPGKFYPRQCDVSDENSVIENMEWIENTFGTVHILINNAGKFVLGSIIGESKQNFNFILKMKHSQIIN